MIKIRKRKNSWKIYDGAYLIGKVIDNGAANQLEIHHDGHITYPIIVETHMQPAGDKATSVTLAEGSVRITTAWTDVVMIPVKEEEL